MHGAPTAGPRGDAGRSLHTVLTLAHPSRGGVPPAMPVRPPNEHRSQADQTILQTKPGHASLILNTRPAGLPASGTTRDRTGASWRGQIWCGLWTTCRLRPTPVLTATSVAPKPLPQPVHPLYIGFGLGQHCSVTQSVGAGFTDRFCENFCLGPGRMRTPQQHSVDPNPEARSCMPRPTGRNSKRLREDRRVGVDFLHPVLVTTGVRTHPEQGNLPIPSFHRLVHIRRWMTGTRPGSGCVPP
jgi:hypothetical protein